MWLARFPGGAWRAVKSVEPVPGREAAAGRERHAIRLLLSLSDPASPPGEPLHPALLPVLDLRESPGGGAFAYAMPLADSLRPGWERDPAQYRPRTLASDILARRALPLRECLALAEALASALDFLQRHCLVHRDLKPANVLFVSGRPVLADFGLLADTREAASLVGTPGYVPDEQHGRFPADLFSLGILLSEAATGRPAAETGYAPVEEADTDHPLYARFLALLRRTTDPDPARRPQTAAAFLKELRALRAPPRWRWLAWLFPLVLLPLALLLPRFGRVSDAPPPQPGPEAPPAPVEAPSAPEEVPPEAPAPSTAAEPPAPTTPEIAEPEKVATSPQAVEPPEAAAPAPHVPRSVPVGKDILLYLPDLFLLPEERPSPGAFLQLYDDRIRVGLPGRGPDPADCALLMVYPPETPRDALPDAVGAVPCVVRPLLPATGKNTPGGFAGDPAFPAGEPTDRRSRTGIAFLPLAEPYPGAVFLLTEPAERWKRALRERPPESFEDVENRWLEAYVFPRALRRKFPESPWMDGID